MNSEAVGRAGGESDLDEGSDVEEDGKWWMRIGEPLLTGVMCGVVLIKAGARPGSEDHPYRVNRDGGATHASEVHT